MGCHFLLLGCLPDPGIQLVSPALADRFFNTEPPGKPVLPLDNSKNLVKESGNDEFWLLTIAFLNSQNLFLEQF